MNPFPTVFDFDFSQLSQRMVRFGRWIGVHSTERQPQLQEECFSEGDDKISSQLGTWDLHSLWSNDLSPVMGDLYTWMHHTQEHFSIDLIQNHQVIGHELSLILSKEALQHGALNNDFLPLESIITIPNTYVVGRIGAWMTPDWVLMGDHNSDQRGISDYVAWEAKETIRRHQEKQLPIRHFAGTAVSLTHMWPHIYGHFLVESFSKLSLFDILPQAFDAVIIADTAPSCAIEVLALCGISTEQVIQIKADEILQVDQLIIPSTSSIYPFSHKETLTWVRQKITPLHERFQSRPGKVVYWPRFDNRLANEGELMIIFEHWGVQCIDHRKLSLMEQIQHLKDVEVFICFHGSGLTNLIFLPSDAVIIEIQQRQGQADLFKEMAKTLQYRFVELKSEMLDDARLETEAPSHHMPSILPPKRLETFLRHYVDRFLNTLTREKTVALFKSVMNNQDQPLPMLSMKALFSKILPSSTPPNRLMACKTEKCWPSESNLECYRDLECHVDVLESLQNDSSEFQYLLTLQQGAIFGNEGAFLTAQCEYIEDFPLYYSEQLNSWFNEKGPSTLAGIFEEEDSRVHFLPGKILCLTGMHSYIYWHFLIECIAKLLISEKLSVGFDGIAVSSHDRHHLENALHPLGISLEQVHFIEKDHLYFADELLLPSMTSSQSTTNVEAFQWLREKYLKFDSESSVTPFRKIFWARNPYDKRRFSNADEIIPWLAENGFEIYEDVPRTVEEQARIFSEASVVVLPHGSGATNLIFCQPNTQVIEIKHQYGLDSLFNMYKYLSESCGLRYSAVISETTFQHFDWFENQNDHAYLHLEDLIQKLAELNIVPD